MNTVIVGVPAVAMSEARIVAVNTSTDPKFVARATPLTCMTEFVEKLKPLAVSVKPAPPAAIEVGLIETRLGTGVGVIVSVWPADVPPPGAGVNTVIVAVPGVASSDARNCPVIKVELIKFVALAAPFI